MWHGIQMTDQSWLYFVRPDTFPLFNFLFIWSNAPSIFWAGLLCFCITPNLLIYHWPCQYCTTWIPLYGLYCKGSFYFISFWKTPINRLFKKQKNKSNTAIGKVILLMCMLVVLYVSASVIVRSSTQRWEMAVLWVLRLRWRCRSVWTYWRLWVQRLKCAALTRKTRKTDSIWAFTRESPPASDLLEGSWLCSEQLHLYAE